MLALTIVLIGGAGTTEAGCGDYLQIGFGKSAGATHADDRVHSMGRVESPTPLNAHRQMEVVDSTARSTPLMAQRVPPVSPCLGMGCGDSDSDSPTGTLLPSPQQQSANLCGHGLAAASPARLSGTVGFADCLQKSAEKDVPTPPPR